jgi:hypothetical protein
MNAGTHDSQLIALLKRDYLDLLPHLAFEPYEECLLAERIKKMFIHDEQCSTQETLMAARLLRIDEYLLFDLPIHFAILSLPISPLRALTSQGCRSESFWRLQMILAPRELLAALPVWILLDERAQSTVLVGEGDK